MTSAWMMPALALPPPGTSMTTAASARMMTTLRSVSGTPLLQQMLGGQLAGRELAGHRRGFARVHALGREAISDAEVRMDVAPLRRGALELLAQLAHEHVDGAVAVRHRIPPHALVDRLALQHVASVARQQTDQLELAARQVEAAGAHEGLELVGANRQLARFQGRSFGRRSGDSAPPHDRLDARNQLLRMTWLREPVVGSESQRTHALSDGRRSTADDRRQCRKRSADLLEIRPARRAEHEQVDDERPEPQRDEFLDRHGAGKHPMLPATRANALVEDMKKAAVAVDHGQAEGSGPRSLGVGVAEGAIRSHGSDAVHGGGESNGRLRRRHRLSCLGNRGFTTPSQIATFCEDRVDQRIAHQMTISLVRNVEAEATGERTPLRRRRGMRACPPARALDP